MKPEQLSLHMEHDITMEQRFLAIKEKVKVKVKEINTYS